MANDRPQLGNLNFDDIKSSIINFIKDQNVLKDVDYEASAIQVLVDTLAYNTMYYGFYANMIANEMFLDTAQKEESLISLVKPLGYTVPGKISSKAIVEVNTLGTLNVLPAYTRFGGSNSAGTNYNFYTIEDIAIVDGNIPEANIIEGKLLVKQNPIEIDLKKQTGFIYGLDLDITTLTVEVFNPNKDASDEVIGWEIWVSVGNFETNLDSTSKVYWLERQELGFAIVFGSNFSNTIENVVGSSIQENNLVRVSYLRSSGSVANEVSKFSIDTNFTGAQTETITASSGGLDSPNLDAIRFYAPKWFSAQDRAITINDCKAVLTQAGIGTETDNTDEVFNIWGGETMTPPRYGRLFVSIINNVRAQDAINILKEKTCVTIIPELIEQDNFRANISGTIPFNSSETQFDSTYLVSKIIDSISNLYPIKYNNNISSSKISTEINKIDSSLNCDSSNIKLQIIKAININAFSDRVDVNFRNSIEENDFTSSAFIPHTDIQPSGWDSNDEVYLRINPEIPKDHSGYNTLWVRNLNTELPEQLEGNAGKINLDTGKLYIIKNIIAPYSSVDFFVTPSGLGSSSFNLTEHMVTSSISYNIVVEEG